MLKKKFFIMLLVMLAGSLSTPSLSFANGTYTPGTVLVNTASGIVSMQGQFNVRHNAAVSQGWVSIGGSEGENIGVLAVDSRNGTFFYCYAAPGTAIHTALQKVLYGAVNGTTISASRISTNSVCSSGSMTKDSKALN